MGEDSRGKEPSTHADLSMSQRVARRVIQALLKEGLVLEPGKSVDSEKFHIAGNLVKPKENSVLIDGNEKKLTPMAMNVLVFLVENREAPVSIETLINQVWGGKVVTDASVHRCVSELRAVFSDDQKFPEIIKTVAKRGYQVIADVEVLSS